MDVRFGSKSGIVSDTAQQKTLGRIARGLVGHNQIESGGLLPLPAPAEQTQRTEAGRKQRAALLELEIAGRIERHGAGLVSLL